MNKQSTSLFDPRTFSTDWEIMALDRLDRLVSEEKLAGFATLLTHHTDVTVQLDYRTLELAMGINTSFAQLCRRLETVTDLAGQMLREWEIDLFPAASHPRERLYNANHIHIGTLHDETAGIHLESRLLPFMPAFAALACNSPVSQGQRGRWKSYRVRHRAHGCTQPVFARDPHFSQNFWGFDGGVKLQGRPTFEVRITDAASSRRFLAELATFVAAYVHHIGNGSGQSTLTPETYRDHLTNRWSAARHGLQAGFVWQGKTIPVVELLSSMLDECRESLGELGATREDFAITQKMLDKRTTQSDRVIELAERYPDDYALTGAWSKLTRHWNGFEEWLDGAPALEPLSAPGEEEVLHAHRAIIGEGTHFYRTRDAMFWPPPAADAMLEQLIERGDVRRERTTERGTLLHRIR